MANAWIIRPLPIAAASASTSASGFDPINVANDFSGIVWRSNTGSSASITVDLGSDQAIDTAALIGATGATPVWTLTVAAATQAQGQGFGATVYAGTPAPFLAGSEMPTSKRGRAIWSNPAPIVARYWRFTIAGLAGGAATIARIVIGRRIQLARNFRFGAAFGLRDMASAEFSRFGVFLPVVGARLRSTALSFGSVYRDEVEGAVHPLIERQGAISPILLVTDPDPHPQRQNRMFFGPMVGDLGTIWPRANGFEWNVSVVDLEPIL